MTRIRRRLLIGTVLVVLVLLGLGGWFYHAFYGSTYAAIRHAEAFKFRRLQVAQLNEPGTYRFFYTTNRRAEPGDENQQRRRFLHVRNHRTSYFVLSSTLSTKGPSSSLDQESRSLSLGNRSSG